MRVFVVGASGTISIRLDSQDQPRPQHAGHTWTTSYAVRWRSMRCRSVSGFAGVSTSTPR